MMSLAHTNPESKRAILKMTNRRRARSAWTSGAFAGVAILCASPHAANAHGIPCGYTITVLPEIDCGAWQSAGNAIAMNNLGEVLLTGACGQYSRTYLWTGGNTLQILPLAPGMLGFSGWDLNDNGLIVGTAITTTANRGYIHNRNTGQWTELLPQNPPSGWSTASAVTSQGVVVGFRSLDDGGSVINPYNAFIWTSQFEDLGVMTGPNSSAVDIAEDGTVVGWTGGNWLVSANTRAFIRRDGRTTVLPPVPGGINSAGLRVSTADRVLVRGMVGPTGRSFAYFDGAYIDLGILPGFAHVLGQSMNADGTIVGILRPESGSDRGFIWHNGVLRNLNELVAPDVFVYAPASIRDDGTILLFGRYQNENVSALLHPVWMAGDVNADCTVDVDDLIGVILAWGEAKSPADVTHDGVVDVDDLILVILNWT